MSPALRRPGRRHIDGIVAKVGHAQVAQQHAAVGVRIGAHPPVALRRQLGQLGDRAGRSRRTVLPACSFASSSRAAGDAPGYVAGYRKRHLVRRNVPSIGRPSTNFGPGPALGRLEDDHRPARPRRYCPACVRRAGSAGFPRSTVSSVVGHGLMHLCRLVAFDEVGRPAVAAQQLLQFLVRDARQDGRVGDLVAVEMQDRQHRAVGDRVEELVGMPGGGQRDRFPLRRRRRRRRRSGPGLSNTAPKAWLSE